MDKDNTSTQTDIPQDQPDQETGYCYGCKENSMKLSDNELIYECKICNGWHYSSS